MADVQDRVVSGLPFVHTSDPAEGNGAAKPAEKTDTDKRLEALEKDLVDERKARREAEEDAKFWATRNKAAPAAADDSDDEPAPTDPADADESPDALLDAISKDGLKALRNRGFATKTEIEALLQQTEARAEQRIAEARSDATFEARLGEEFPEIAADAKRVDAGEAPKSEIFKLAGRYYQEYTKADPKLLGSKSTLLMCARLAKSDLAAKGGKDSAAKADREEQRRQRIEEQRPERAPLRADADDDEPDITEEMREVGRQLGVSEKELQTVLDKQKVAGKAVKRAK